MASLDKTSVRAEVDQLKTDFERLCAEGKISSETKTLFTSMLMIIELILAIFLERTPKIIGEVIAQATLLKFVLRLYLGSSRNRADS